MSDKHIPHEYADKYVSKIEDLPTKPHWVIITQCRELIPGDERSKKAPGHGYPEHTLFYLQYAVYLTEEKWKRQLLYLENQRDPQPYRAVFVNPAVVEKDVQVKVSTSFTQP